MIQAVCPITSIDIVGCDIFVLAFSSPEISSRVKPGQFINIKINNSYSPFLRRPFSVYHVQHDTVRVIFDVVGAGTKILSTRNIGGTVDVLGPLGCAFNVEDEYETALLVAGGVGVAPLPMITGAVRGKRKIVTFLGARTKDQLVRTYLEDVHVATDDGSEGFHGTIVDLLRHSLTANLYPKPKIFACGPNIMLKSLSTIALQFGIPCEVSIESVMACGFGICQGCPIERTNCGKRYSLVCKDGPVFDSRTIRFA